MFTIPENTLKSSFLTAGHFVDESMCSYNMTPRAL